MFLLSSNSSYDLTFFILLIMLSFLSPFLLPFMFPEPDIPALAKIIFIFGSQGAVYWNYKLSISQVNTAIIIAEFKYSPTNNTVAF